MRVTNEQAKADAICELYCPDCDLAMSNPEEWHCPHGEKQVRSYALDLLEARELIKEMRAKLLIGGMQATSDMKMFRSIPVDSGIISDLIKRTKEYA